MPYPAAHSWNTRQGQTFDESLTWKIDGQVQNVTGYTGAMQVRDRAGRLLATATVTLGGVAGTVRLVIDKATMSAIPAGSHDYDVELTSGGGVGITLIAGKFNVAKEATK